MSKHAPVFILLLTVLSLSGCRRGSVAVADTPEPVALPQFSDKRGLFLPGETRRSLGLEQVEVSERSFTAPVSLKIHIYERTDTGARASGMAPPSLAAAFTNGQPVTVSSAGGRTFEGRITGLSRDLLPSNGMVEVLVDVLSPPALPSSAEGLEARLPSPPPSAATTTIPAEALLECSEGQFVYTVSGDHFVRTAVSVGRKADGLVEITDGLYPGDQVVLRPVMALWQTELAAVKGGQACCATPPKGK